MGDEELEELLHEIDQHRQASKDDITQGVKNSFRQDSSIRGLAPSFCIYSAYRRFYPILIGIVVTSMVIMSTTILSLPHIPSLRQCGSNPTTALANGCTFDILAFAWLPPACQDMDLTKEFLARDQWSWFATPLPDTERDSIPLSLVQEGIQGDVFISYTYATTQCEFLWRKLQRHVDKTGSKWADEYVLDQSLLMGCTSLQSRNRSTEFIPMFVRYPNCRAT